MPPSRLADYKGEAESRTFILHLLIGISKKLELKWLLEMLMPAMLNIWPNTLDRLEGVRSVLRVERIANAKEGLFVLSYYAAFF